MFFSIYPIRVCIALGFLIPAAIIDAKTKKVPNILAFPMILIGLVLNIILTPYVLIPSLAAMVVCFVLARLPGVGMGDIKLLMGMSAYLSCTNVMIELALASVGVLLIEFIKHPKMTYFMVMTRRLSPVSPEEAKTKTPFNSIAFAPYLLIATLIIEGGTLLANYIL